MNKRRIAALVSFLLAIACWLVQYAFYGDIDEQGFIRDSLFLPLGYIFLFISAILLGLSFIPRRRRG